MARGIFSNWKQPLYYNYDKKLTKSLMEANENKPYIQHPTEQNEKVFIFADVPHMVKLLRNHFLDEGIFIDNKHLTHAPLIDILENDISDLKIAPKLSSEHLTVKRSKRQKVKYATQLFSHTNSCALNRMGMLGILKAPNWQELSELINTIDEWFNIFNSKAPRVDSRPKKAAYGLEIDLQKEILSKMESIVLRMRFGLGCSFPARNFNEHTVFNYAI